MLVLPETVTRVPFPTFFPNDESSRLSLGTSALRTFQGRRNWAKPMASRRCRFRKGRLWETKIGLVIGPDEHAKLDVICKLEL